MPIVSVGERVVGLPYPVSQLSQAELERIDTVAPQGVVAGDRRSRRKCISG
ncbi:MAG: hypothetical protein WBA76_08245 [Phormidesmis sp.]